jgi:hypothetical protein
MYLFNNEFFKDLENFDDLDNVNFLEKKYYNENKKSKLFEMLKELSNAKKIGDQDLIDFLKDEIDNIKNTF